MNKLFFCILLAINALCAIDQTNKYINVSTIVINDQINTASELKIKKLLDNICNDNETRIILLYANSGGGSVSSTELITEKITECKQKKLIITWIPEICASGCYWIAAHTHFIIASPSALVGSIGSVFRLQRLSPLKATDGNTVHHISHTTIRQGKYNSIYQEVGPITKDDIANLQGMNHDVHAIFVSTIRKLRPVSDNIEEWDDGKIFSGTKALELKLVDVLGGMPEVLKAIQKHYPQLGIDVSPSDIIFQTPKS